jgi:hypothetical protein
MKRARRLITEGAVEADREVSRQVIATTPQKLIEKVLARSSG